jgi:hypothetical protein
MKGSALFPDHVATIHIILENECMIRLHEKTALFFEEGTSKIGIYSVWENRKRGRLFAWRYCSHAVRAFSR